MSFISRTDILKLCKLMSYSLILFSMGSIFYRLLLQGKLNLSWLFIPIAMYILSIVVNKLFLKKHNTKQFIGVINSVSIILLYVSIEIERIAIWVDVNFETISFAILMFFLLNQIIVVRAEDDIVQIKENVISGDLFNLFYINTPKVHELAMLIDNKIMKAVEKEQAFEERLKHNSSINFSVFDKLSANSGYAKEENLKNKVYESFDVKITKSIMLRKIYENTQKSKGKNQSLTTGTLMIFENVEFQQRNIDDTVMILNVLQDSNMKQDPNEELEINFKKMMEKMLDDFTIDYTFTDEGEKNNFIIQLPYKSNENFENGYQHNDLQLGKLSLIGIYRGEIDFSLRESVSSKFLEIMDKSYSQEMKKINIAENSMKLSHNSTNQNDIQFDFKHEKLNGKLHLIDVVAIIQVLDIYKGD